MTPVLGATVGAYRLEEIVASDELGTLYGADDGTGTRRLVRLLTPLAGDPAARRRFQIEFAAIARLDHPSILRVEDWGEWEGTPYVVTADPGAERLSTILAGGRRLNPRFVLRTVRDLAAALDHAHLFGVVHGAVEPARVLVAADGSVRLSDFGLTAMVGAGPDRDVAALMAVARDLLALAPPPPPALAPGVDAALHQPWETCGAFVDALEAALSGRRPQPPASLPLWRRLLPPAEALPKRLALWMGLGGAALAVLLLVIVLAAQALRPSAAFSLTPPTANPGDTVVVSGTGLPDGQPGTVTMSGRPVAMAQFQADGSGAFKVSFTVPLDVSGNQTVQVCWGGSCPLSRTLIVVGQPSAAPADAPTPVPVVTPTAIGATPTPGTHRFSPAISLGNQAPRRGQTIQVSGRGFDPAQQYVIFLQQGGHRWTLQTPASPDGNGDFSSPVRIPGEARRGFGVVAACISLVSTGQTTSCAEQPIAITG